MAYKNIKNIIISTSCNLFSEKGYRNVSVNEICSACSITKPTFYYHFKSKEDIIFEEFNNVMINSINTVSSISRSRYGKNMVINGFECIYDEFSILGYDLIQNIIIGTLNDIQRVFYFPEAFKKYIVSSIKKGQRDGSIQNSTEPELLYDVCCHTFIGYILFWCQHNGLTGEYRTMAQILSSVL